MDDPLDPLKKIQQHLDALRRMQNIPNVNISNPRLDTSKLKINFTVPGGAPLGGPALPDPLVEWLLEDLSPRVFHDFVTETVGAQRTKGYRPGHVPRAEGLKILKKRFEKDPIFRTRAGLAWLQGRKREEDAFKLLKPPDIRRDPWPVVERFGFPLAAWLFALSGGGAYRGVATQILKDVASRGGKLDQILAEMKQKAPSKESLWALPDVSHDDELTRIQGEVENILAERDRCQTEAAEEKTRRKKIESELSKFREENQRLSQARTASEHGRLALEAKVRELESHLEALRGAESAIKRLEKQAREFEHNGRRLLAEKNAQEEAVRRFLKERDSLARKLANHARTVAVLKSALASDAGPPTPLYQGQILLLLTAQEPAAFFESAKKAGLTLLVHDGRAKNAQFEKFLEQAWRVLVWGENQTFHESVWNALEETPRPVLRLPDLPARVFEKVLAVLAQIDSD